MLNLLNLWKQSQDDSFVAYTLRHPLAIEVLEQRNGVFAAYAGKIFESRNVDLGILCFVRCQIATKLIQSVAMKNQLIRDFDQQLFAKQQSNYFLRANSVDFQTSQDVLESGHFQPSGSKGLLNGFARFSLFVLHHHTAAG